MHTTAFKTVFQVEGEEFLLKLIGYVDSAWFDLKKETNKTAVCY